MIPDCDGRSDGQTESIIANTALCIARAMLTRCNKTVCVLNGIAYTELGGDEELPLGEEFQELLKRFVRPHEKKVPKRIELIRKLIDQLA